MLAISPTMTKEIDRYAEECLGTSVTELMGRAGDALARLVCERVRGRRVLILAGCGNNGGDGYAAACTLLRAGYTVAVLDVTGAGQKSGAGRHYLAEYEALSAGADLPKTLAEAAEWPHDCLVDAILGTGARLPLDGRFAGAADLIATSRAYRIAVDLPLGVDAEGGEVDPLAVTVEETLMLGYPKTGLFSYPARAHCGRLTTAGIGLDTEAVRSAFPMEHTLVTPADLPALLPRREANTHKGSFGHLLMIVGSRRYRGAALMASAAALRMGAGLVSLASEEAVLDAAVREMPELILVPADEALAATEKKSAILLGCGCEEDGALADLLTALLFCEGAPLILDAGAINVLATMKNGLQLLRKARRPVVLTPHPAEMARLCGITTAEVQARRLPLAKAFVREYPVTLVLKGAGTVIAEGEEVAVNLTGGPALAKGGSGDVLAGAVASLIASGLAPLAAAKLAVCLHGTAGDRLAERYSPLGVRPSDLPAMMAEVAAEALR